MEDARARISGADPEDAGSSWRLRWPSALLAKWLLIWIMYLMYSDNLRGLPLDQRSGLLKVLEEVRAEEKERRERGAESIFSLQKHARQHDYHPTTTALKNNKNRNRGNIINLINLL